MEAKNSIFLACGKEPKGFRAPAFSIQQSRDEVYELLSKYFIYDSSYVLHPSKNSPTILKKDHPLFNGKFPIVEFPIVSKNYFNYFNIKSGGTFFRLFTKDIIEAVLKESIKYDFTPMIYLHPYDYLFNREFLLDKKYFRKLGIFKGSLKYFRQYQWLGLRNKTTLPKLNFILEKYNLKGRIIDSIS